MLQASLEDTEGLLGPMQDGDMDSHTHGVRTLWTPATTVLNPTWTTMTEHCEPNDTVGPRLAGKKLDDSNFGGKGMVLNLIDETN